jgi:hypothetical protein
MIAGGQVALEGVRDGACSAAARDDKSNETCELKVAEDLSRDVSRDVSRAAAALHRAKRAPIEARGQVASVASEGSSSISFITELRLSLGLASAGKRAAAQRS